MPPSCRPPPACRRVATARQEGQDCRLPYPRHGLLPATAVAPSSVPVAGHPGTPRRAQRDGGASGAEERVGERHPGADPDGVVEGVDAGVERCGKWFSDRRRVADGEARGPCLQRPATSSLSSTGNSGDRPRVQLDQRVLQPWRMLMSSFVELGHMSSSVATEREQRGGGR
jgi:hypothetical protein